MKEEEEEGGRRRERERGGKEGGRGGEEGRRGGRKRRQVGREREERMGSGVLLTCCGGIHYRTCEDNEIRLRLKLLDCVCDQF